MIAIILLYVSLSLGTFIRIPIGDSVYQLQYVEIILFMLSVNILFNIVSSKRKFELNKFDYNIGLLFLLLFSYSIYMFLWSDYGSTALPGALPFLYGLLALFISSYYYKKNKDIYINGLRVLVLIMLIQLSISMFGLLESDASGFYAVKDFARTPMGKSNLISFYFVFGLLYEFISKEKHWLFFFMINLIAVVLTLSRGAIFSLGFSLIIYLIIAMINSNFKKAKVVMSFIFLIAVLLIFMYTTAVGEEFLQALRSGLGARTVGTRQVLWNNAFMETVQNPFGVGVVWMEDPHNIILSAWRNLGFVLGSIYVLFLTYPLFYLLHSNVKTYSAKTVALLVAYSSVFIHAFIEIYYFSTISVVFTVLTINFIHMQLTDEFSKSKLIDISTQKFEKKYFKLSGGYHE